MSGLPFRSKLAPFEGEIVELRRRRPPVSYRQITALLKERHGIDITVNGVFVFLKTRRKWDRRFAAENKPPVPMVPRAAAGSPFRVPDPARGTDSETPQTRRFNHTFSATYNLTRLTPEEKAAFLKELNDRQKGDP